MTGATFLLVFAAVAAFIGFLVYLHRRSEADLKTFASKLGVEEMKAGVPYEADLAGQKYRYEYTAAGKNRPASFTIWLDCPSAAKFNITRESHWDAFFKRMGLTTEIQTGDVHFDDACYVRTDFVTFTKSFFQSLQKRQAVLRLIELNYKDIAHDGTSMIATMTPFRLTEDCDKLALESVVGDLALLSKNLPAEYPGAQVIGIPAWKIWRACIYLLSAVSLVGGLVVMLWASKKYTVLDENALFIGSLGYSVLAFIAFIAVSMFLLKGRSSSHNELMLVLIVAVIGFPLFGYGATLSINGYLDVAEPRHYQVKIVDKRISKSSKSTIRYISVASWRKGRSRELITVGSGEYKRFDIGSSLRITTRPGRLGYEWLADYELVEYQD